MFKNHPNYCQCHLCLSLVLPKICYLHSTVVNNSKVLLKNKYINSEQMTFGKDATLNWISIFENNGIAFPRIMTENRKRSREDDSCEFMPLSKRINNLHINNNLSNTTRQSPESSHININGGITVENVIPSSSSSSDSERRPSYDPGVTASQSSYFYDNKLLFELHLERIQRSGQQFPF